MDYVEYKITKNDELICKYVFEDRIIPLSKEESKKLYYLLKRNNIKPEPIASNEGSIIRCYGIRKYVDEVFMPNRQRKRKVERKNLIKKQVIQIGSGVLALTLFITSLGCYVKINKNKKIEELPIKNITIQSNPEFQDNHILTYNQAEIKIEEPTPIEILNNETFIEKYADYTFDFEFDDRSQDEKAINTKNLYHDTIKKYSDMYGVPVNLMIAIATQERGVHSQTVDKGGGFGLFQIQAEGSWNWLNKKVSAYNFETKQNETLTVCLDQNGKINKNMLGNLEYNTKIACMLMASNLKMCNNDIITALQTYNSGTQVLKLKEKYGEDWVNHRDNLPGDPLYIEHVLSYINTEDNFLEYKDKNNNYVVEINNLYNSPIHSL